MKHKAILVLIGQLSVALLVVPVVNAQQTMTGGGYGYTSPLKVVSSTQSIQSMTNTPAPSPTQISGFIQFNNLVIQSVSAANPPAEILVSNPAVVYPAGESSACYHYDTQSSVSGQAIYCPTPPTTYQYRIEVDASTRLLLRDRTAATLSSFSSGDQINVFGYYNSDGTIQAYLIRDLSKPVQDEFIQLNNVNLVSISASTTPATLVVAQAQGNPCYGFGAGGEAKQSIVCPLGAQPNTPVPSALMPVWQTLRKYVINIDAQTIILDSNHTSISLSALQVGDQLNIYGDTTDNGQTLTADIVRDLSLPAAASTYNGKVTQVNTDGSFVIQTNDGQTITVQNPIQVGATVQLTGLLDRLKNILSQVSSIYFGGGNGNIVPMMEH